MEFQITIFLSVIALAICAQTEFGNIIARFEDGNVLHDVAGTVYAVNERTLYIRNFYYDGEGPAAYFYTGTTPSPAPGGIIIPLADGNSDRLTKYSGQDVVITLTQGEIRDYNWISVWCDAVSVDFGHVDILPGDLYPSPVSLGPNLGFNPPVHGVTAVDVLVLNPRQIQFIGLTYDGRGPAAYFWTGSDTPDSGDTRVPHPPDQPNAILPGYGSDTVTITLPEGFTAFNIDFIGIWCEIARQDFGHVIVRQSELGNLPPYIDLSFEPQTLDNCQVLLPDRFHVSWTVDQASNKITLELRGIVSQNEYLAFGISGSSSSTFMIGSDVSVVWFDPSDGSPRVEDYYLNAYSQCLPEEGTGACPDVLQGGSSDVELITAEIKDGISIFTIERPLNPSDSFDSEIVTNGDVYISWGIGFINPTGHTAKHDLRTNGDVTVNFGMTSSRCPALRAQSSGSPGGMKPWPIPPIRPRNNATFVAVIGPSGGQRGYQGIAEQVGWGLAWYINGFLIPEIHVVRGNTYTFKVYGGNDNKFTGTYHPLYITDDKDGGYLQKTDAEKELETIYAAPAEGDLCEYEVGPYQPEGFTNFLSYKATLKLRCKRKTRPGILVWTVAEDTPDLVYYQCYQHKFFGWKIHVSGSSSISSLSLVTLLTFAVFASRLIH